jgi:hypothetical protein
MKYVSHCFNIAFCPAIAQAVNTGIPPRRPDCEPGSDHAGSVMDRAALDRFPPSTLVTLAKHSFHQLLHNHRHLSSTAGAIGQLMVAAIKVELLPLQPLPLRNSA